MKRTPRVAGVVPEAVALVDHQELAEAGQVDEVGQLSPRRVEGRRVAPDERLGPIEVAAPP